MNEVELVKFISGLGFLGLPRKGISFHKAVSISRTVGAQCHSSCGNFVIGRRGGRCAIPCERSYHDVFCEYD